MAREIAGIAGIVIVILGLAYIYIRKWDSYTSGFTRRRKWLVVVYGLVLLAMMVGLLINETSLYYIAFFVFSIMSIALRVTDPDRNARGPHTEVRVMSKELTDPVDAVCADEGDHKPKKTDAPDDT